MGTDDEFMEIIQQNDMETYMSESESQIITIKEMHIGVRDLSECIMYITDFITAFMMTFTEDNEDEERPTLSVESVVLAKELFSLADKFTDSIVRSFIGDDDEDDDEDDEEYEDDEEEEE